MRSRRVRQVATIAAGYLLGAAALYGGLPGEIPPSWRVSDLDVVWLGGPMAAFLLPTASATTAALLRGLCARSAVGTANADEAVAMCDAITLRVSVFLLGLHATVLVALLGWLAGRGWSVQVVPVMLGLTMISIGNLLPRTRPNPAIGIRTARTLADRTCWMRTHRLAGYIVAGSGGIVVVAALTAPAPFGARMILAVGPLAAAGIAVLTAREARRARRSLAPTS